MATLPDDLASQMTKREAFCMQAMTAAYMFWSQREGGSGTVDPKTLAKSCLTYADALITLLNKKAS